jgi:hypothetical protein
VFSIFFAGCSQNIIPEMKECMDAHGSRDKYIEVIKKYAAPSLQQSIIVCCALEKSRIIHSEKAGDILFYWEEGRLPESCFEIPSDAVQIVKVGWKDKKIVYIEFLGPMKCNEDKYIKSKEELLKEKKIAR